jgi:hypothetical protein
LKLDWNWVWLVKPDQNRVLLVETKLEPGLVNRTWTGSGSGSGTGIGSKTEASFRLEPNPDLVLEPALEFGKKVWNLPRGEPEVNW